VNPALIRQTQCELASNFGPFKNHQNRLRQKVVAPGITLTFDTVSRPRDLEENLRDGMVDVAIDWLPIALDPFVNSKLFDGRMVLVARKNHPRVSSRVTIEGLRKERFISLHDRRDAIHLPQALRELQLQLGDYEDVRVSELLQIPTVVATLDPGPWLGRKV
jgi:DNA-binding transcriptional LysR family regulator